VLRTVGVVMNTAVGESVSFRRWDLNKEIDKGLGCVWKRRC
jgi:hypothetical protein